MKELIIGVWAHPDDEMGSAGSMMHAVDSGAEVHFVYITAGQKGENPDNVPDLGAQRIREATAAAECIGVPKTHVHALGFEDGEIGQLSYTQLQTALRQLLTDIVSRVTDPASLSFVSLFGTSPTGHPDHQAIAETMIRFTKEIADQLPAHIHLKELCLYCLGPEQAPSPDHGTPFALACCNETDRQFDAAAFAKRKVEAIACHHSQRADGALWQQPALLTPEYFKIIRPVDVTGLES